MLLDLNDPKSIVEWLKVYPSRHGALLRDWASRRADVRPAIVLAGRLMRADPACAGLLAQTGEFQESQGPDLPAVLSHDELAAGEGAHDDQTEAIH